MSVPPKRPTKPKTTINRRFAQNQAADKNRQTQARSTGRAQPMTAAQQKAAMESMHRQGRVPKPTGPARRSLLAGSKEAQQAQNQARSTGRKQPLTESQAKALGASARNKGIQARQVTPAELSRIKAGNKHRNTKRPPKQATQIKPSASKTKGPTNAPLKSRRASAQNRMAQRKASMMARRSK